MRFVGLADADPERRSFTAHPVEDYRAVLGSSVAALDLPFGEGYELVCASGRVETIEIDILTA